jgi:hypothetical protein
MVRSAEIEAEARLSQDANFPAMQIVERLDEVLRAPTPSAQLGNASISRALASVRTLASCRHLTPSP